MNPILKKLSLTGGKTVLILNSPKEFLQLVKNEGIDVHTEVEDYYSYVQIFAESRDEADELLSEAMNAVETDGKLWFCYPKSGTDLNEKTVFNLLSEYDLSGVAKVPLNDKWVAIHISYSDDEDDDHDLVLLAEIGHRASLIVSKQTNSAQTEFVFLCFFGAIYYGVGKVFAFFGGTGIAAAR